MNTKYLPYTWLSTLLLLSLVFYFYLLGNQDIANLYNIPSFIFEWRWQISAITFISIIICLDMRRFYRRQNKLIDELDNLKIQIQDLKDNKKQLQTKANAYSGQADKLKLFISDRLLEYIEYDEKFLHFKGIAAEVRHNGIISYDKILIALQTARNLSNQEQDNDSFLDGNPTRENNSLYDEALTSLNYLWDLLDLSTADNIALHINNHICECEEYYYQKQLQDEDSNIEVDDSPYSPTFFAHNALLRAIQPLMADEGMPSINDGDTFISCETDNQFRFVLDKSCELLGNENHLVLVIENLIKNALFYSNKIKSGNAQSKKYNRVTISLTNNQQNIEVLIYNHGPHIADDIKDQIFQLGYTTRRKKDEHGRGLGLYFVKEITNGYEGNIVQNNIHNQANSYSIRIELDRGGFDGSEIITHIIETVIDEEQLFCVNQSILDQESETTLSDANNQLQLVKHVEWKDNKPIKSIEITPQSTGKTQFFADFDYDASGNIKILDPDNFIKPLWVLDIQSKKRSSKVVFTPLDITGVEFKINLPCAGSQFDYEEDKILQSSDEYLTAIEDKFKSIDI